MATESAFHTAFWVLVGGVLAMRVYFVVQIRRAGERLMPDREAVEREGRGAFAVRVVMGVFLGAWLALYAVDFGWVEMLSVPFPSWLRWAGFVLGLVSLGFWTWAQLALGRQWSPQLQLRERHRLVTTGPYARIRHPLYTAMFGYSAGLALVTANWVFLAFALLAIVATTVRVPKEEKMMIDEFGEDYEAYMRRSGRFFPRLDGPTMAST
jgi:protein-S-isoprenylcysteine O-methyltransferase Ste14